jgi:hypothetical protein
MISGWLDNPSYRKFLEHYTELKRATLFISRR